MGGYREIEICVETGRRRERERERGGGGEGELSIRFLITS